MRQATDGLGSMAGFQANARPFEELDRAGRTRRLRRLALTALTEYDVPVTRVSPLNRGLTVPIVANPTGSHGGNARQKRIGRGPCPPAFGRIGNTAFRVDGADGGRYVLRVQRPDGPGVAQVRSELRWLAALCRDTDLVVPRPVRARSGDLLTVVADPAVPEPRTCVLLHRVNGRFADERLGPAQLYRLGEFTARLQRHGARMSGLDRGRADDLGAFGRSQVDGFSAAVVDRVVALVSEADSPARGEEVREAVERARAARAALGFGADVYGLVHGGLDQETYLFHHGRVRVADFDSCGFGHYAYDLAVTVKELDRLPRREELTAALLDGYRSVHPAPFTTDPEVLAAFVGLRRVQLLVRALEA